MIFFAQNMGVLKKYHPSVIKEIRPDIDKLKEKYQVLPAKNGQPIVKVGSYFLHSKYNPSQEAEKFINIQLTSKNDSVLLYGFGFGYHITEALKRIKPGQLLYVFELNTELFTVALYHAELAEILAHPQLRLFVSSDESDVARELSKQLKETNSLMVYQPSARSIPEEHDYIKFLLESWEKRINQVKKYAPLLQDNYLENQKHNDPNVSKLFSSYRNKPVIIVSSGPSLNKNKHLLVECKGKALIFAVGSALKSVTDAGVVPDLFCIIDPIHETTRKQIEGYEELGIPFVYLDTASYKTVAAYKGPRFVAANTRRHNKLQEEVIETGGSVATAVMDISIKMGGNPIIFIGQDLAFTDNRHHAYGSMYGESPVVKINPTMKMTKGQDGEMIPTSLGLLSYKYWIEQRIKRASGLTFINATEGGAYIEGCEHIPLKEVIKSYIG